MAGYMGPRGIGYATDAASCVECQADPAQCHEHPKTEAQERASFEAWIKALSFEHSLKRWDAAPVPHWTGQYVNLSTQLAWEAWRAAKATGGPSRAPTVYEDRCPHPELLMERRGGGLECAGPCVDRPPCREGRR
jgi:hypothetical protein